MAKTLEKKFWQKIKLHLTFDFIGRIENELEPGWPDVHYINQGDPGWIELKAEDKFPKKINFEPAQPIWLERYWNLGGECYVFLYVKQTNKIYIWAGKFAKELAKDNGTYDVKPMLVAISNNKGWDEIQDLFSSSQSCRKA